MHCGILPSVLTGGTVSRYLVPRSFVSVARAHTSGLEMFLESSGGLSSSSSSPSSSSLRITTLNAQTRLMIGIGQSSRDDACRVHRATSSSLQQVFYVLRSYFVPTRDRSSRQSCLAALPSLLMCTPSVSIPFYTS